MHAKVTLLAPDNVRGEIHGSQTGQNYTIAEDGKVVVDAPDSGPLIMHGGFSHAPRDTSVVDDRLPPASDAPRSTIEGATAIREEDRDAGRRPYDPGTGQQNEDHGGAIPPHGKPAEGHADAAEADAGRAQAAAEVDAAKRAGMDPQHRSAQADVGSMDTTTQSRADQDAARDPEPRDHHDETYQSAFKDHAGQEGTGDPPPTIRGRTQAEVDAASRT